MESSGLRPLPDQALVSVIIPAYNASAFIGYTLDSVLAQTYTALEVLVVDDGSQDGTAAIVQGYQQRDARVRLLRQSNAGVAAARNRAIAAATGEWIAPLDADDIWFPPHLERLMQAMLQAPASVGVVYGWSVDLGEQGNLTGGMRAAQISGQVYGTLVGHNFLGNASASVIRRSALAQVGGYDSRLRSRQAQGCEDWDLYLRLAEQFEFQAVPTFSVGYRKPSNSMSADYQQMARSHRYVMAAVQQRHPDLPAWLFRLSTSNLYIYFAHQSHRAGLTPKTLFWLTQALRADPITSWWHMGLYRLALASLGRWLYPQGNRLTPPEPAAPESLTLAHIHQRKLRLALMLGVGQIFHYLVQGWIARSRAVDPGAKTTPGRVTP